MSRPFVVDSPEIKRLRQAEFVFVDGASEVQELGYFTSKEFRMFWATEAEVTTQLAEIVGSGWVLDGDPSLSAIYPPLDLYNVSITCHKHTDV